MNQFIHSLQKRKNEIDKPYCFVNTLLCLCLFFCGFLTRHTCDYIVHTAGVASVSFRPALFWALLKKSGYPLWSISAHVFMKLFFCSSDTAAGICTGFWLMVSFGGVLYFMLKWFEKSGANKYIISVLCFVLFIVGPIWIPWKNPRIIIGCGGPNVWHNATNICGRAVGIFAFFFCMAFLERIIHSDYKYIPSVKKCVLLSFLLFFSLFAKPSFLQSFGPSFALLAIYHLIKSKGKMIKQIGMLCAISVLPFLFMIRQFFFYFSTSESNPGLMTTREGSGIVFSLPPFSSFLHTVDCQILILMFPMIMTAIMYFKRKLDTYHAAVWLMDGVATFCACCLSWAAYVEMGWSVYIAYFFVYLIGIRDYISLFFTDCKWNSDKCKKITFIASTVVLLINLLVGIIYLYVLIVRHFSIF